MFKISSSVIAMLNAFPRKGDRILERTLFIFRGTFRKYRKRISTKLQNPRLNNITFRTFRQWKATKDYHRTKDILHVTELLGHRDIKTTLIYTQLINFEVDEYHSATANTTKKAEQLIQAGFEHVCTTPQDMMLFRKRK